MANHLIIGLGGTGGKVIRELRKRIYEEFRSIDPEGGAFLGYLYVDSSTEELNDKTGWKVLGKKVHLGEAQKVNIHGISTSTLQNLSTRPGLKSFINDNDKHLIDDNMGPLITAGLGGQRRRLGRMLMANNLSDRNSGNNFEHKLKSEVGRLQQASGTNDVTFNICAGLAGGTGSGSIVDVISQIRKIYPYQENTHSFKIRLFVYVPEINVVYQSNDQGFYQANGYAALKELNAINVGKYKPYDVTGEKDVFTQDVQRLLDNVETFEVCYLYTNVNERGNTLDLLQKLPQLVADFLFQTTVVASISGAGKMSRLVGCENDGAGPEHDLNGDNTRSRKFITFGITRIEYPETEIGEYVTYNYAVQATRQLTYNLWQDGIGYVECTADEVSVGYLDQVKDIRNRSLFKLSNPDLTLEKPLIDSLATKNWKPFSNTWETRTQQDAGLVQKQSEKKLWLSEFTKLIDDYYNNSFRKHGVKKFFEIQDGELKAYARTIRRHVEKLLFDEWASGGKENKSLLQIEEYTKLLIKDCGEDRVRAFKEQIAKLEQQLDENARIIKDVNVEWNNIGWLRDAVTNASSKAFAKYKTAKCNYYIVQTKIESYNYAVRLLQQISIELASMLSGIQAMRQLLNEILDNAIKQASAKCQINNVAEEGILKKYNPDLVHSLTKQYVSDYELQSTNSAEIRRRMVDMLGEDGEHSFANLNNSVDVATASDLIIDICSRNARAAMEDTAVRDPSMKMVGVNILDKLRIELGNSDDKKEKFVKDVVSMASPYAQLNPEETGKVIGNNSGAIMSMIQVALPKPQTELENKFVAELAEYFQKEEAGFNPKFVDGDLSENFKPNQLVVVCAKSGLPLRFLLNIKALKEKYDKLLAAPQNELNKMVLHTESGLVLPELFELGERELELPAKKTTMLAMAMKLIQPQQDPITGEKFFAIKETDEIFGDQWVKLGKDYLGCVGALKQDIKKLKKLESEVDTYLATQVRSNDQKAAMAKLLGGVVQKVILPTVCEGNQFDPKYAEYKKIAMEIINTKLKSL